LGCSQGKDVKGESEDETELCKLVENTSPLAAKRFVRQTFAATRSDPRAAWPRRMQADCAGKDENPAMSIDITQLAAGAGQTCRKPAGRAFVGRRFAHAWSRY